MSTNAASIGFEEPDIITILIQSSFLLLLNGINYAADALVSCGLVGQVAIGLSWGTPGAKLLDEASERFITQYGYLGLLLLVFEGGLSTSLPALRANLPLSIAVALTGIGLPIALSFVLIPLVSPSTTPLDAFAAGVALSSTSLGTTFTVLSTTGLATARIGVVLSAAAMLDDVVGLVMVQVISAIGRGGVDATTIIRPLLVALGFAASAVLVGRLVAGPLMRRLVGLLGASQSSLASLAKRSEIKLAVGLIFLIGMVTASTYAGTSNLFAAYIAGAVVTWLECTASGHAALSPEIDCVSSIAGDGVQRIAPYRQAPPAAMPLSKTFVQLFKSHVKPALDMVLRPFFFASIGFSIPITRMFQGPVVWRGLVYALLMALGKLACGVWLIRLPRFRFPKSILTRYAPKTTAGLKLKSRTDVNRSQAPAAPLPPRSVDSRPGQTHVQASPSPTPANTSAKREATTEPSNTTDANTPRSLYPSVILGSAMVARGEVGFLISSVGQSTGALSEESFLIATWAILLCTIVGPVTVGLMVKRLRKLETKRDGRGDVLGVWGVE